MSLPPKTAQDTKKGWFLIALIAIPTLIAMILGVVHGAKSQNVWKEKEPQWIKDGQDFGQTHSAQECVDETLKKEHQCEEIVCANLVRSFAVACLNAAPKDDALCRSVPIQPSRKRYSQWAQKVCKEKGYEEDLGCRTGLVGLMESCHPIPHNNYFPNILDKNQSEKSLMDILLGIFQ